MKIAIIGPGKMSIPPIGWGAVESLIWDMYQYFTLIKKAKVLIINTMNLDDIRIQIKKFKPDVIHLQYDDYWNIMKDIDAKVKIATSHFGYLDHPTFFGHDGYQTIFNGFIQSDFYIFALSPTIVQKYIQFGCHPERVFLTPNGANSSLFQYNKSPFFPNRSIYLAKIETRKCQYKYQSIPSLWFAGNIACHQFRKDHPRWLGEWSKEKLYQKLTHYTNLVLLSNGEAHPLVCCEALICGLGLVVSEPASANLDSKKPFITIIPNDKLDDIDYVQKAIIENRKISLSCRDQIREYGLNQFSWNTRANYIYQIYEDLLLKK